MTLNKGKVEKSKDGAMPFIEDSASTTKEKQSPKEETEKVEDLSNADLLRMMKGMQKDMAEMKSSRAALDEDGGSVIDDFQDEKAVFFCFSDWHGIYTDKRKGKEILPPHGPIRFDGVYRWRKRHGQDWKVVSVSQFSTNSKSEIEYLKKHTEFGIKFFENIDVVKNLDASFAQKQLEQHGIVSRMNDMNVVERAKIEGLAINNADVPELRRQLTAAFTKKAIEGEKMITKEGRLRNDDSNPEMKNIPSHLQASKASPQANVYE